ncbi:MAG TPA: hypothetical protein VFN25_13805 [Dokdonella sp.]|uniref:hypothetical protein n=1 Tax=Dokdonella sp. TaxID=2291710 RepID=UPI002D7ED645|nr:hypothetical protein [Dokdonella sp.]HET9033965.1 hypothetical protein [Dokdonella sp.]
MTAHSASRLPRYLLLAMVLVYLLVLAGFYVSAFNFHAPDAEKFVQQMRSRFAGPLQPLPAQAVQIPAALTMKRDPFLSIP